MKPTFCKLAAVSLCSLLLFSCSKKDSAVVGPNNPNEISTSKAIAINNGQFEHLTSIFQDTKSRNTYIKVLKDSIQNLANAKTATDADAAYPDQYNPNIYSEDFNTYTGDPGGLVGGVVGHSRYNINIQLFFHARPIVLYVTLPFYYNDLTTSHPNATQAGPISQNLLGSGIGALEIPSPAYMNIREGDHKWFGNAAGNLIEKRTIAVTSDGKTVVKGGLNAAGVEVGAELSNGSTVTSTTNSVTNFSWDVTYEASFVYLDNPYNPNVTYSAHAKLIGSIP